MTLFIPFSCQDKHQTSPQIDAQENTSEFFVNEDMAKIVAENFMRKTKPSLKSTQNYKLKKIKDEMGEDLIYVINFDEGGFILMPADNRIEPILAFSENNYFETKNVEQMNGVGLWVSDTKEGIKKKKKFKDPQTEEMKQLWKKYLTSFSLKEDDNPPDPCVDSTITVGPLISTEWCQGSDFNLDCPTESWVESTWNCSADFNNLYLNGRARVGCVAIAMGMIMNYHEHPTNYSWSQMPQDDFPSDHEGNSVVADLLVDIGNAVDMRYQCSGSYAENVDAVSAFENDFGYSTSATLSNYYYSTTKVNINADRPVYFYGAKSGSAHAWVCDGYKEVYSCIGTTQYNSKYLYMHFGEIQGLYDAFFLYNSINGYSNLKIIYGIDPS